MTLLIHKAVLRVVSYLYTTDLRDMAPTATTNGDASSYPNIEDVPVTSDFYLNRPDPENDVEIPEELLGTKRKLRVVVLGCGVSGINFFKFAEDKASKLEIRCYEKNADVGGTWLENRYPGCACDVSRGFLDEHSPTTWHCYTP